LSFSHNVQPNTLKMHPTASLLKPWILTSPASRGIGFAITRHLLKTTTAPIIATARSNPDDVRKRLLADLPSSTNAEDRLTVTQLDVHDESSIERTAALCKDKFGKEDHLHLAFLIPGILSTEKAPDHINKKQAEGVFQTNTIGPMLLVKHFARFLPKKTTKIDAADSETYKGLNSHRATMALMSARVGSITDNVNVGGWYSYRMSKAAVSQLARTLDLWLKLNSGDKAVSVALHPGTVNTEFSEGYRNKDGNVLEVEESAEKLCDVVARDVGRGRIWDYAGKEVLP